jgi:hypothetical protein
MSGKKVANHLHRYRKINLGANGKQFYVYRCTKPACSHYVRIELAEGKLCECNKCGEPMIITKTILTHSSGKPMALPHCLGCIKRKKADDVDRIKEYLDGIKTPT